MLSQCKCQTTNIEPLHVQFMYKVNFWHFESRAWEHGRGRDETPKATGVGPSKDGSSWRRNLQRAIDPLSHRLGVGWGWGGWAKWPCWTAVKKQKWMAEYKDGSYERKTNKLRSNTQKDEQGFLHFSQPPKKKSINKITGIYIYIYISKVHYGTKI